MWVIASWSFDNWTDERIIRNAVMWRPGLPAWRWYLTNCINIKGMFCSDLSKVAVLGSGPCHFGALSRVHREPTVPSYVIRARQLILFVGHAAVMGTVYIGCLVVQFWAHFHHWATLPLHWWCSLHFAWAVDTVMDLKPTKRTVTQTRRGKLP